MGSSSLRFSCRVPADVFTATAVTARTLAHRPSQRSVRRGRWQVLIFDDSFEHEVWHEGGGPRVVLIIDVWHPELDTEAKRDKIRRDFKFK